MAKQQYKTNSDGQLIATLPRSGVEIVLRSPKGKDSRALQAAIDADGSLSDYDLGLMLIQRCLVSWGGKATVPTMDDFDELDLADIKALEEAIEFFRA